MKPTHDLAPLLSSYLEHNASAPSMPSEKVSIPEGFDWLQEVTKWRDFYRAQSLSLGSPMRRGSLLHMLVPEEPKRLSRRLKRLEKTALPYGMSYWIDEPYNYFNTFYTAGESKTIEHKGFRIQALPKVSRVRNKSRRNR
jgi:hypothetical protein